jgi:hypothetical protein
MEIKDKFQVLQKKKIVHQLISLYFAFSNTITAYSINVFCHKKKTEIIKMC